MVANDNAGHLTPRGAFTTIASKLAPTDNTAQKSRLDSRYPSDKAVTMISMSTFHAMLVPILAGMIMLAVGFNFRDKNAGVFGMWIGMLTILATVVIKILAKLNE
ncbi:Magnesium transporter [Pseudomonas sp. IT-P291]